MRISINLATRPFVELRPLFARLRIAMAVLVLTAIGLGFGLHRLNVRARAAQAQVDVLKQQTDALLAERQANEARMMQPQNQAVLNRSKFLNALFARKSFSWTSVMMDLESVLPAGIQVTSIEPVISAEGETSIRLRVNGERDRAVELVRNLERSQRFLAPRLVSETAQMQEQGRMASDAPIGVPGGVEFEIMSGYNPLPGAEKDGAEKKDAVAVSRTATQVPSNGLAVKAAANGGAR